MDNIWYEPHPCTPERAQELWDAGFQIIDAIFAPEGWTNGIQAEAKAAPKAHPLDHDMSGEPGGSLPAAERGLDDLKAEAEALGVRVDRRWGEARLIREIEAVRNADD